MVVTVTVSSDGTLTVCFAEVQPGQVDWAHALPDLAALAKDLTAAPTPPPAGGGGGGPGTPGGGGA